MTDLLQALQLVMSGNGAVISAYLALMLVYGVVSSIHSFSHEVKHVR